MTINKLRPRGVRSAVIGTVFKPLDQTMEEDRWWDVYENVDETVWSAASWATSAWAASFGLPEHAYVEQFSQQIQQAQNAA